jgi:NTE family protein
MKKTGYVLSGGGARGFAHLGVLKFLEELNIRPYAISGTSAGAIIGALYASGKEPEEILKLMKNNNYFGWSNILWNKAGLFSTDVFKTTLNKEIKADSFEALKIKLFVAATDLNNGSSVIFSEGPLFEAVLASASVPILFEPVKIHDQVLVDGGLLNNFPVEPLVGLCDVIIGSHVNKLITGLTDTSIFKTFNVLERCFHIAIAHTVYEKVKMCDLFIEPSLHLFDMYDVKHADRMFEIGYDAAFLQKEDILKVVS